MHMQESLIPLLETSGAESIVYKLFEVLPLRQLCIPIFVLATFISFVTAADSNTNAIASVCTSGMSEEEMEAPAGLKILWGMIIGVMAAVMAVLQEWGEPRRSCQHRRFSIHVSADCILRRVD